MSEAVELVLHKSKAMIDAGHGNVNAMVNKFMIDDGCIGEHPWALVYRWGNPRPGCKVVFAAQCKMQIGKSKRKVTIQLHRFVMGAHAQSKDGGKRYVIPKDGNALNCVFDNLMMLTQAQWEERNHRNKAGEWELTEEQELWINARTHALGLPRKAAFTAGIMALMESEKKTGKISLAALKGIHVGDQPNQEPEAETPAEPNEFD